LAAPSKWGSKKSQLDHQLLQHLQKLALQWARLSSSSSSTTNDAFTQWLANSWAVRSALWQLEWLDGDEQKALKERLAESMAQRLVQAESDQQQSSAETQLLYLKTLERQSKWEEMLHVLDNQTFNNGEEASTPKSTSIFGVPLTKHQILLEKAKALRKLGRCRETRAVYELLLESSPDDWSCWKGHLESAIFDDTLNETEALVRRTVEAYSHLRGPRLMLIELAAEKVRKSATEEAVKEYGNAIRDFATAFAHRALCVYSDLEMYLNLLLRTDDDAARQATVRLLEFAETMRTDNSTAKENGGDENSTLSNRERQSKIRAYIFAIKLTHKLLSARNDLVQRFLPDWVDIVFEWRATLSLSSSNEGEEVSN
jgi:tetratricopeptide (TPR) repeat protein